MTWPSPILNRVGLGTIERSHIPGMQAVETYAKLRVLGKPGVGKTTFLQHLAVQCNRGEFCGAAGADVYRLERVRRTGQTPGWF